jgi:hypothetical protein
MKRCLLAWAILGALVFGLPLVAAAALPTDAIGMLAFMREEEKLAHDVYLYFSDRYAEQEPDSKIFANITESEQRHTDAVRDLLDNYGLEDPTAGLGPGEFQNPDLQGLYYILVMNGDAGFAEALGIGVLIEEKDLSDIAYAINLSVAYPDIVQVYSNLLAGSEHHLSAFLNVLGGIVAD